MVHCQVIRRSAARYRGVPSTTAGKPERARQALTAAVLPHMQREEAMFFPAIWGGRDNDVNALIMLMSAGIARLLPTLRHSMRTGSMQ
ncbi:hypothetical protein [Roseiflexus sp.]|uniref:hypothetical protein n=1 Tax=Roseiflexus sp. TaxID=2562120 RepID=UPI0021DF2900|nr:hypothetical protein [Roseiflexus sp.]GIW01183.1 MAG: hypothetical protein KatS3mg058_2586 [Roseiflexus sp.]